MPIQIITEKYQSHFNSLVTHPLQSWQWGQFREKTGVKIIRLGEFKQGKLISALQVQIHPLPFFPYTIGYLPKCNLPSEQVLNKLTEIGHEHQTIFIKLEPNVSLPNNQQLTTYNLLKPSSHPLFTKYTFQIDLTKSENELFAQLSSKTRYNVRLAKRKGVTIQEENTSPAFETYLQLMFETTKRQGFYAHDQTYHQLMWQALHKAGIAHLITARYQGEILVTWILFLFNHVLYYPYGASTSRHKQVMASNLIMWEAIRWGKQHGARIFDLWGTPGPNPQPSDPYYGFHKFKLGYGPKLVEFVGSYDLVLNPVLYSLFNLANNVRWNLLRLSAKFKSQKSKLQLKS